MVALLDLLVSDPVSFFSLYFLIGLWTEGAVSILKTSLLTSLVAYPFVYLGKFISEYLKNSYDYSKDKSIYVGSVLTFIAFWIILRIWYMLFSNSKFAVSSFTNLLMGLVSSSAIVLALTYAGYKVFNWMTSKWEMPRPISYLLITYLISTVFWVGIYLYLSTIQITIGV